MKKKPSKRQWYVESKWSGPCGVPYIQRSPVASRAAGYELISMWRGNIELITADVRWKKKDPK